MDELASLRRRIDDIDEQLVKLLNDRVACAIEIGKIKNKKNMDIYNPEREKEVIQKIIKLNKGPFENASVQRIFEIIIKECRNSEKF